MKSYTSSLSYLKIGVCLILFRDLISFFVYKDVLFGEAGIVPTEVYHRILDYFGLTIFNDFFSPEYLTLVCLVAIGLNVLFFLNVNNLLFGGLLYLVLVLFRLRNIYIMDGHDNLIALLVLYLSFYNNKFLSVTPNAIAFLVKFQICVVYFFSGLWKIDGELWKNGTALYYVLNTEDFDVYRISSILNGFPLLYKGLTYFTVFFEIAFPIFIWFNRFKLPLMVLGVLLHIGIFILMRIDSFSVTMLLCYVVLLSNQELADIKNYFIRKAGFVHLTRTTS